MIWIGLTGGIASGKSTIAGMLESMGFVVVKADELAHAAMTAGSDGAREIRKIFGSQVVSADGTIDRAKLGALIFADKTNLLKDRLEAILHPEVRKQSEIERRRLELRGDKIAFYEIPLLFEKQLVNQFDFIVTVAVSPEIQVERLMKRSGLSRADAELRIQAQLPQVKKIEEADFVIWNDGNELELKKQVEKMIEQITNQ